jgi:hypothetical protein
VRRERAADVINRWVELGYLSHRVILTTAVVRTSLRVRPGTVALTFEREVDRD